MLELRDVSFRVSEDSKENEIGILEHVSFTLEENKFVAITGPNGGGKSTRVFDTPTPRKALWGFIFCANLNFV